MEKSDQDARDGLHAEADFRSLCERVQWLVDEAAHRLPTRCGDKKCIVCPRNARNIAEGKQAWETLQTEIARASRLSAKLRSAQAELRALVTIVDGHVSIMLPKVLGETGKEQAARVGKVVRVLEFAGIGATED